MAPIDNHPLRYALVNELHARPFPNLDAPCHAVYFAIKQPVDAHNRDRGADRDHLLALLDRNGAVHPPEGATHHAARIGRYDLKWESHTEFVTYSAFGRGLGARPFDPAEAEVFPADWMATAPGKVVAAILIRVEPLPEDLDEVKAKVEDWFVAESVACSWVLDEAAIIAGDFQIDPAGMMRFAAFVRPGTGQRRIGRIVQRLCEIETYRVDVDAGLCEGARPQPAHGRAGNPDAGDDRRHDRGAQAGRGNAARPAGHLGRAGGDGGAGLVSLRRDRGL